EGAAESGERAQTQAARHLLAPSRSRCSIRLVARSFRRRDDDLHARLQAKEADVLVRILDERPLRRVAVETLRDAGERVALLDLVDLALLVGRRRRGGLGRSGAR